MRSPDQYTGTSDSHEDEPRDEDRGRPAQAIHGTITRHAVEYIPPSPPPREHPSIVPIPRFEGTLVIPHDDLKKSTKPKSETDDDDEGDGEDEGRARQSAAAARQPVSQPQPKPAQSQSEVYQGAADVFKMELADVDSTAHAAEDWTSEAEEFPADYAETDSQQPPAAASDYAERPVSIPQPIVEAQQWAIASSGITPPARPAAVHSFTPPPMPPSPANTGGQPPLPPIDRPPVSPDHGYPNSNTPPPSSANFNNAAPIAHPASYDRAPVPAVSNNYNVQPSYISSSDKLARLGVIGNFIGNRRTRRRLGRKIDQHHKKSDANFADIQSQQLRFAQQQRTQDRELYNLRNQVQSPAERVPAAAPLPVAERQQTPLTASKNSPAEVLPPVGRTPNNQPVRPGSERLVPLPPIPEQRPVQAEDLQNMELHPDEHVQQTAWHKIVVKNGKEVEGAIQYGEGFRKERQQEIIRDRTADKAAAVSLGGMAVGSPVGGQYGGSQAYGSSLPSGMTRAGLQPGAPAHADPQHQLPEETQKDSAVPGPVFWVMLLVIVAAFFAAALI